MKLLAKINLVLVAVFVLGMYFISHDAYNFLKKDAKTHVLAQARLMEASASAFFDYTEQQVSPILEKAPEHQNDFLPQTIPFYAVNAPFEDMRSAHPGYSLRETALNPLNLDNRATDWEADLIDYFRDNPGKTEHQGERSTPLGPILYVANALVTDSSCRECHGQPADAPRAQVKHYGDEHGYGWPLNQVSGAQIVSVPMSVPMNMARHGLRRLLINLGAIFLLAILLVDITMYVLVIRPLRRVSKNADIISKGEIDLPPLEARGKDEIAEVTASFNRMHTSLIKAFAMLKE